MLKRPNDDYVPVGRPGVGKISTKQGTSQNAGTGQVPVPPSRLPLLTTLWKFRVAGILLSVATDSNLSASFSYLPNFIVFLILQFSLLLQQ